MIGKIKFDFLNAIEILTVFFNVSRFPCLNPFWGSEHANRKKRPVPWCSVLKTAHRNPRWKTKKKIFLRKTRRKPFFRSLFKKLRPLTTPEISIFSKKSPVKRCSVTINVSQFSMFESVKTLVRKNLSTPVRFFWTPAAAKQKLDNKLLLQNKTTSTLAQLHRTVSYDASPYCLQHVPHTGVSKSQPPTRQPSPPTAALRLLES